VAERADRARKGSRRSKQNVMIHEDQTKPHQSKQAM
jgi:hypothetical protein